MNLPEKTPLAPKKDVMPLKERLIWGALWGAGCGLPLGIYSTSQAGDPMRNLMIPILAGALVVALIFAMVDGDKIKRMTDFISRFPW